MNTSKPLYVYLQRPDTGEWVTVGRYRRDAASATGRFLYAPSYAQAGLAWSIDPVNLPFLPGIEQTATRYRGLHDALRDAAPDSWGRTLLCRAHDLPANTHDSRFLLLAGNADRWGALAIGQSPSPAVSRLASPRLAQWEVLNQELLALHERRPPVDARLRKRLLATASLGGARPKATVQAGDRFWLVKPRLPSDGVDLPLLEHATHCWGSAAGMRFAATAHHAIGHSISVLRVLRFDRRAARRHMALSAASLLQTEYPAGAPEDMSRWSYPRLAEQLQRIGAPLEDRIELFERMVFNAVVGNDDDHPRNHAALWSAEEQRWRLSPAYDVVPDPHDTPGMLAMQLSTGRRDITREALLADAHRFGFVSSEQAEDHLQGLLRRISSGWPVAAECLTDTALRRQLEARQNEMVRRLS